MILLARASRGWSLADIEEMDLDDFDDWSAAARKLEERIAKALRGN